MPTQAWNAGDFQGLTPAIEPTQSDKLFVLNGQNYVFDSKGPRSDFGNRYLTPYPLGAPAHVQGFRLRHLTGDRVFVMTSDSILEWSEVTGAWRVIFVSGPTGNQPYRWTQAYLDGWQYFCHPAVGILGYNPLTGVCDYERTPGVPSAALAICVTNGRLCAIDLDRFYFSATSNGKDWIPRLGGAGFVKIGDRVPGDPIMVTPYESGALVWTRGGVMRAQFTGDVEVFQFRSIDTELRPVNSFCTAKMDSKTTLILDERGLFQTKGDEPTPFNPLFNEFLMELIQSYNLRVGQNLRLEWDDLQRRLYVSVSLSIDSPLYEYAFVLYPSVDKWGQFNEEHYGIFPIRIDSGSRADDLYGFADRTGRVRYWNQLGSRETLPVSAVLNSFYPVVQKPTHHLAGSEGYTVSSSAVAHPTPAATYTGFAGYFPAAGGSNSPPAVTGLDARIQLGLVGARAFGLEESVDQLIEVLQVRVGSIVEGDVAQVSQGFSLAPVDASPFFGPNEGNYVNSNLRVISTLDGKSQFQEETPELVEAQKGMRYYSCSLSGVWHIIEFKASTVGEAFRLRSLGLTVTYAGKLG
jgi:hypothetical protein